MKGFHEIGQQEVWLHGRQLAVWRLREVAEKHATAAEGVERGVTAVFGIDRVAKSFAEYAAESAACYRATLEDVLRLIAAFA